MVNLKTKLDKHTADNEKRRKSIKEKEKTKINQCQIIKQALSNVNLNSSGKKTVFSDEHDGSDGVNNIVADNSNGAGKSVLFDSSDSGGEDLEIREKSQFSGKKGFELLNLQSTYGNDERFKIDERFLENDTEKNKDTTNNEENIVEEKVQQLKILEDVLGIPNTQAKPEKKSKKRVYEMVRYDANNKDHEIYEINKESTSIKSPSKRRKEKKEKIKTPKTIEVLPKTNVSKEKFYEVSGEIKSCFKDKKEENHPFSLLQTYAVKNNEQEKEEEEEEKRKPLLENQQNTMMDQSNDWSEYNSDVSEDERKVDKVVPNQLKPEQKVAKAKGIWKEAFFFEQDDERFKEGIEFMNKKHSAEASEAAESYNKKRRQLKEILRLHVKKQTQKNDPFKHKVGGMSKKQLINTKYKNTKSGFKTKKSTQKKNFGAKI